MRTTTEVDVLNPALIRANAVRPHIELVVRQHVEEVANLFYQRVGLVRAPHVGLLHLARLDERIAAHVIGIAIAEEYGTALCRAALGRPGKGELFAAGVNAIGNRDTGTLAGLLDVAALVPESRDGMFAAFGWASPGELKGYVQTLLEASQAFHREIGLAACAMHGVDPLGALDYAIRDDDVDLRLRAFKVAGRLGRRDLREACLEGLNDADCAFEAARSGALLGDRSVSIAALEIMAFGPSVHRTASLALLLQVVEVAQARKILGRLSTDPSRLRDLIRGVGLVGDPYYVPWLIQQMHHPKLARISGESFSLVTGLDLAWLDLERRPPEDNELRTADDAADDIAMDEDDGLAWPDPERIEAWWTANSLRFVEGKRHFMGELLSEARCESTLKGGCQRQRIIAAAHLRLLSPGAAMFNVAAPAARQQRWLNAQNI